ncbi:MAG: ferredoxin reductase [Hahellaceae bacterium]|nr:ferredoxin reductase [Hahellaceae bacterium]MCP5212486.1 ferredoxin reductase [Hahellaceae bacterium]
MSNVEVNMGSSGANLVRVCDSFGHYPAPRKVPVLSRLLNKVGVFVAKSEWLSEYSEFLLTEFDPALSFQRNPARVLSICNETHDTRTFVLKPLRNFAGFSAGQHVSVEVEVNGVRRRRNYTISSSPERYESEGVFTITVKIQPEGKVSNALHSQVGTGDLVYLGKVSGEFLLRNPDRKTLMLAAGSGITPFMSMLEDLNQPTHAAATYTVAKTDRQWVLMYYVRSGEDLIFGKRLERLAQLIPGFIYVLMLSDKQGNISTTQIKKHCADLAERQVMLCGPGPFMDAARSLAEVGGVALQDIHQESFGASIPASNSAVLAQEAIKKGTITFKRSGKTVSTDGTKSILEVAESLGLNPKYGCRAGVCHECKCAKTEGRALNLLSGKVMDSDEGMVQTCVTVPYGAMEVDM